MTGGQQGLLRRLVLEDSPYTIPGNPTLLLKEEANLTLIHLAAMRPAAVGPVVMRFSIDRTNTNTLGFLLNPLLASSGPLHG